MLPFYVQTKYEPKKAANPGVLYTSDLSSAMQKSRFSNTAIIFSVFSPQSTMAGLWDLLLPLMMMMMIFFFRTLNSLPTTSQPPEFEHLDAVTLLGSPTEGYVHVPEDYGFFDDTTTSPPPIIIATNERCDYKPCLDDQPSCYELSATTGCLCPGFTLNDVPPEAPSLEGVAWNGSEVVVKWCEPLSDVSEYVVTVGGQDRHRFGRERRSGGIGQVDNVVQVCVSAVNEAGESVATCAMYQPEDRSLPLTVGLIGGALGLLLVLLLGVLVWRRRRQRKQEADISSAH